MRALSYTVNDDWAAQRLIALGTDGIITDRGGSVFARLIAGSPRWQAPATALSNINANHSHLS
jgi:hypothetical protein